MRTYLMRLPARLLAEMPPHIWVGLSSWASRLVAIVVQLGSIPLLVSNLGADAYAAYSITISMLAWFALAEVGTGLVLQNLTVRARIAGQFPGAELGAAIVLMAIAGVAIALIAAFVAPYAGRELIGIGKISGATSARAFLAGALLFTMAAVGTVAVRLLYGLGRGIAANALNAACSLAAFALLWAVSNRYSGEALLVPAILAYALPLAILPLVALAAIARQRAEFHWSSLGERIASLWRQSRHFLLVSAFAVVTLNLDYLVLSQFVDAQEIASYNLMSRTFGIAFTLFAGMAGASGVFWLERSRHGDWDAVRASLRRHIVIGSLGMILLGAALILISADLAAFLDPSGRIAIDRTLILAFIAYALVRVFNDTFVILMQSLGEAKALAKVIPVQAVFSFAGQVALVQYLGAAGIVIAIGMGCIFTVCIILPRRLRALEIGAVAG
ncbi:MAG: hypothetical protein ACKOPO_05165 [Novosphingobium sp.]